MPSVTADSPDDDLQFDDAFFFRALFKPHTMHPERFTPSATTTLPSYPPSGTSTSPPAYRLSPDHEGGLGLFATRAISTGEIVISESPLFQPARTPAEIEAGVAGLSAEDRAIFFSFTDACNPKSPTPVTIMKTNGVPFGTEAGDGGIFPFISRINHSCAPNVYWHYNEKTGQMVVVAITDIPEGAEYLVTYIPLYAPRKDRMFSLLPTFQFVCRCSACRGPENPDSDRRRRRLATLANLIENGGVAGGAATFRIAKESVRLMDEEGLHDFSDRAMRFVDAYKAAIACNDLDAGRRHVRLAYGHSLVSAGPDDPISVFIEKLCSDPTDHVCMGEEGRVEKMPVICDRCGKEGLGGAGGRKVKGGECGECHTALYCSRKCKVEHAARHKAVCAVLQKSK